MINWIREKLLRLLLPKKQFYIQAQGFHSHFHSVFNDVITRDLPYEQEVGFEVDNGGESIH